MKNFTEPSYQGQERIYIELIQGNDGSVVPGLKRSEGYMEFQRIEQAVGVNEVIYEGAAEQPVDTDITLPDYCPDVQRILKCMVCPRINSVQTAGERITADGSALVRIVYVGENGKICSYEQSYPFSKYAECKGLDAFCCATAQAQLSYVNCRAVSQRRVDVHGMLNMQFRAVKKKEEKMLCGAEGKSIQMKKKTRRIVNAIGEAERAFSLSEVMEISDDKPPMNQLLHATGITLVDDSKAISNKLLIKGEFQVKMVYIADTPEAELVTLEHAIPLSQIIELEGVEEDVHSRVCLQTAALDVLPKSDSSGEQRLLDITARVSARVSANREIELPVIVDAYSTKGDMKLDLRNAEFRKCADRFSDTFLVKETVNVPDANVMELWCADLERSASLAEDALLINGTVNVHILYTDADNQPNYAERPVSFQYKRALHEKVERLQCEPDLQLLASSWAQGTDGNIELRLEIKITADAYAIETDRVVAGIELMDEMGEQAERAPLIIYYNDPGETVWDIARKYRTTVEAVQRENALTAERVEEKCMLMIPGVAE